MKVTKDFCLNQAFVKKNSRKTESMCGLRFITKHFTTKKLHQ